MIDKITKNIPKEVILTQQGEEKIMCKINLKSTSKKALSIYVRFLTTIFKKIGIDYSVFNLPTTRKGVALLKSPHVNKKAKEHFEIFTFQTVLNVKIVPKISLLDYLFINKPKSVLLKLRF